MVAMAWVCAAWLAAGSEASSRVRINNPYAVAPSTALPRSRCLALANALARSLAHWQGDP